MIPWIALSVTAPDPVQTALDLHAKYQRAIQSAKVEYTFKTTNGGPSGTGVIWLKRPNSLRFELRQPGATYAHVQSSGGGIEYESDKKRYIPFDSRPNWYLPPGQIAPVSRFFPGAFVVSNLRSLAGTGAKADAPTSSKPGRRLVRLTYPVQSGTARQTFEMDATGRPTEYSFELVEQKWKISVTIDKVTVNPAVPQNAFQPNPPLGYVSEMLPMPEWQRTRAEGFPMKNWKDASGRSTQLDTQLGNRLGLVIFASRDCPSSKALIDFARSQYRELDKLNIRPYVVWTDAAGRVPNGFSVLKDGGGNISLLALRGTPYAFLITSKGATWGIWQGFDSSRTKSYLKEIADAIKLKGEY